MSVDVCITLGVIFALAATVLLYIFVFPKKHEKQLNKFFSVIKKLLSSDYMLIEIIAKFIYVFNTMLSIFGGFWMLFWFETYGGYYSSSTTYYGYAGLIWIALGPVVCRLLHELFMMFITLVKNTTEIRRHLTKGDDEALESDHSAEDLRNILKSRKIAQTSVEDAVAESEEGNE